MQSVNVMAESHVYWELQPLGENTCGLHALNCILQGPIFRLYELENIASECNTLERDFLIQAGLSEFECEEMTTNETKGNYDFMVLEKALDRKGFSSSRISNENLTYLLLDEKNGFLLNVHNHWLSVRNLHKKWLLFDSKKEKPTEIHLLEFLKENVSNNHTVFLVRDKTGRSLPLFNHDKTALAFTQKYEQLL